METTNTPPKSFLIIGILSLLWNLIGVFAYLISAYMPVEVFEALPEIQKEFIINTPAWATAGFAIAVFGGVLGCIGLLVKKKWAITLFIISLLGILTNYTYSYFLSNGVEVAGGASGMVMPVLVTIIGVFLVYYSRKANANGWIS